MSLHIPYQDFAGGQPTIARVWLEQRYKETEWLLHADRHVDSPAAQTDNDPARIEAVTVAAWELNAYRENGFAGDS